MKKYLIIIFIFYFPFLVFGESYEEGVKAAVNEDYDKAYSIWMSLAEAGHAEAQSAIGYMYHSGHGVKKDSFMAVEWYKKSALGKSLRGQFNIARAYYNGAGIKKNLFLAYVWFRITTIEGEKVKWNMYIVARENMKEIESKISYDEVIKGNKIASECIESEYKNCSLD